MNDRLAGTTWDNPIWFGKFRIYVTDQHPFGSGTAFAYIHDDADSPDDTRAGYGRTVEDCIEEINQLWPDSDKLG